MFGERIRCFMRSLAGLIAAALLLSLPATALAAERENRSGALASAGLLARGAGYGSEAGSKAVRELQIHLRRQGDRPGPIDGLFGPMTQAAVERFQRSHGLAIDGLVGPQTTGRLLAQRAEQPSRSPRPAQAGKPERKSPARDHRAESAPQRQPIRPTADVGVGRAGPAGAGHAGSESAGRAGPESVGRAGPESVGRASPEPSSGLPPLLVALGAALVVAALLLTLRERRREAIEARLNLGLVCAALLAAGVLGAALGAMFATRAAPDDNERTTADSGALLVARADPAEATAPTSPKTRPAATARSSGPTGRFNAAARRRAKRTRSGAGTTSTARAQASPAAPAPVVAPAAATPDPGPAGSDSAPAAPAPAPPPAAAPAPAPSPPAPAAPAGRPADEGGDAVTYTVRPGDALWPIARRQLAPDSSDSDVARKVADIEALNVEDRISSGDPDVIVAGEKLRLR
jgi:Putative peptidoglycan binding domain